MCQHTSISASCPLKIQLSHCVPDIVLGLGARLTPQRVDWDRQHVEKGVTEAQREGADRFGLSGRHSTCA